MFQSFNFLSLAVMSMISEWELSFQDTTARSLQYGVPIWRCPDFRRLRSVPINTNMIRWEMQTAWSQFMSMMNLGG